MGRIREFLKSNFLAGVFVIIPLAAAVWLLTSAVDTIWQLRGLMPEDIRPESTLLNMLFVLSTVLILALGISMLGWASKHYLGRKTLEAVGEIIQRIPVIRSVYSALDQLLKTLASGGGQQFNRVVYVEYPRKGVWTLAFVTGPARGPSLPDHHLNIYVPTTPNPTSGFHLIVPEADVRDAHMKVEDAFKTILSLGIAQGEHPPERRS